MNIGSFSFRPKRLFIAMYLLVGAAMCLLGFWQLQRADEKIQLQTAADLAASKVPAALTQFQASSLPGPYTRVALDGYFEPEHQFLWDNRIHQGVAGFEVITPFRIKASGQLILVNRGWVPIEGSRENLPSVLFTVTGDSSIIGVWTRPSIGFSSGDAVNLDEESWPRVLQHFAFDEIADVLGEPIPKGLVQLNRASGSIDSGFGNVELNSVDGIPLYPDNWQPVASGPERHYGYAFQWFAMFAALTILFITLNSSKRS